MEYFENGNVFKGEYKNGIRDRDCIMFHAKGDREVGKVKGNNWLNMTTLYYANGAMRENKCLNGVLVV